MTRDEIVTALREHAEWAAGNEWETPITLGDDLPAAADLIENQQREIEALRQANEGLRFNLAEKDGGETCRAALAAFGRDSQMMVAIEEMSELTKELCKNGRGRENTTHIAEEIADVEIMLQQMVMLFDCAGQVETFRRYKLERLAGRIEDDGMAFDSLRLEVAKEMTRMDLVREAERLGAFVESVEQYAGKSYVKTEMTVMVPQDRKVGEECIDIR